MSKTMNAVHPANGRILWSPSRETMERSALARFSRKNGFAARRYDAVHAWSVSDPGAFWSALWDFARVIGKKGDTAFVADEKAWMTGARFFPQARLNLAENLLRGAPADTVLHAFDETGSHATMRRDALRRQVARIADGLRRSGIRPGDRVAGILPNTVEALVAVLATVSVGGVWTSCSPDFGTRAIVARLGQVAPKVVFAAPRYRYGGKNHDIRARLSVVLARIRGIATLVLGAAASEITAPGATRVVAYEDFGGDAPSDFARLPFDHPVYILYTSGTTGPPKAIVHRSGGVLLQHLKEHLLHGDLRPGDTLIWYTNTAWMMYHWMLSALGCGAAVALYDGAPILERPQGKDPSPLWALAERIAVTHLGVSPKYLATLADVNYRPGARHDLAALRVLMACGAPTLPHQFDWVYEAVKSDMMFASISGGTEILGSFLIGSPLHPVRRGQLTVPALGHAVAVLDTRGAPVIGRRGDLVCTEPFPSMPLTFWGADGDRRYHETYFAQRPEIWSHGDIAEMTATGGGYVHGRGDATLKPGGVRIGAAELYAACASFAELADFIVFGADKKGDEEIVLCIKAKPGIALDAELAARIRAKIRRDASPRHVPARIHAVRDIPCTTNGKRMEAAARTAFSGGDTGNFSSLANPRCLDEYRELGRKASL